MTYRFFNFAMWCRPVGDSFPGRFDLTIANNSHLLSATIEYRHGRFVVLKVLEFNQYHQRWWPCDTYQHDLAKEVTGMVTKWCIEERLASRLPARSPATGG